MMREQPRTRSLMIGFLFPGAGGEGECDEEARGGWEKAVRDGMDAREDDGTAVMTRDGR